MFSPGGVSPPPTGNPDAKERLDKPTPTPAPRGGERTRRTKRPYPTLTARTHIPHTPPGREGGSPRGKTLHSTRFVSGEGPRRGWGAPRLGEATGRRSAAPASAKRERLARRKESQSFAHGGSSLSRTPTPAKTLEETGTMRSRLPPPSPPRERPGAAAPSPLTPPRIHTPAPPQLQPLRGRQRPAAPPS